MLGLVGKVLIHYPESSFSSYLFLSFQVSDTVILSKGVGLMFLFTYTLGKKMTCLTEFLQRVWKQRVNQLRICPQNILFDVIA